MVSFTPRASLPAARKGHQIYSQYGLLKKRKIPYFYRDSNPESSSPQHNSQFWFKNKTLTLVYYLFPSFLFKFLSLFLFSLHFLFFTYFSPSLYCLVVFLFRILHHFAIQFFLSISLISFSCALYFFCTTFILPSF